MYELYVYTTAVKLCFRERMHKILCELDSVTRHCNYGWPLASFRIDRASGCATSGQVGETCFYFYVAVHRAHTHCRFERHEISSITLSLCLIRVSLLMERTSAVTMENKRTRAVLRVALLMFIRYSGMMEECTSDRVNLA